jgi:hypothetical protein
LTIVDSTKTLLPVIAKNEMTKQSDPPKRIIPSDALHRIASLRSQ